MTNQKDVNNEKTLVDCEAKELPNSTNIDPVPPLCDPYWPSQRSVPKNPPNDWKKRATQKKLGLGQSGNCDPVMSGQIRNDLDTPNRNVIYRYTKAIKGCDEAMMDLFRNIEVEDDNGKAHIVPIIWGSQEKAVAAILQDNVRKDNSLVVDRPKLPAMALNRNSLTPDFTRYTYHKAASLLSWHDPLHEGYGFTHQEKSARDTVFSVPRGFPVDAKYTLYVWALYEEDMMQIVEQVMLRFSQVAYLNIKGVYWEVIVTLDTIGNTNPKEPGDKKTRDVLKYEFEMTAKTYIPQPINRLKGDPFEETPMPMTEMTSELQEQIEKLKKDMQEFS